ncbi:YebC/PmpR family DNA-binding transcriptional regulator [Kushneria phyllosphaerae]|uniref:Probable transcriptional regulatory protein KSP9073_02830 n=1 Tax=Kushneria phyllosphaerae TaxID=2100822 RepID=A0A2R8CPR5_9GAMM|nr:YebC/PmpR family DNA-binding transcriptional regulator [Kushneria phyllosphaerae]SPJ34783.1 Transcriptional regulatory protein PmpR [Kushneria phyllosphaerae]
MAGHSKWANIRHRKAAQDAKKGKVFTRLIRELTVAARQGGSVVEDNPRLRAAVDKALSNNMTRDTIERAITRGAGNGDSDAMEELVYEGYGPGGVAILVECMSDNRNRTVSEVRSAFNKYGGNLGTSGSVAFLFHKQGRIVLPAGTPEEKVIEATLEAGAEDVQSQDDGTLEVVTSPNEFGMVRDALDQANLEVMHSEVGMFPDSYSGIDNVETARQIVALFDRLEDLDDVQNVYANADFEPHVLEALEEAS